MSLAIALAPLALGGLVLAAVALLLVAGAERRRRRPRRRLPELPRPPRRPHRRRDLPAGNYAITTRAGLGPQPARPPPSSSPASSRTSTASCPAPGAWSPRAAARPPSPRAAPPASPSPAAPAAAAKRRQPQLGALCTGTFTVNSNVVLGPLSSRKANTCSTSRRLGHQLQPRRGPLHPLPRLARAAACPSPGGCRTRPRPSSSPNTRPARPSGSRRWPAPAPPNYRPRPPPARTGCPPSRGRSPSARPDGRRCRPAR